MICLFCYFYYSIIITSYISITGIINDPCLLVDFVVVVEVSVDFFVPFVANDFFVDDEDFFVLVLALLTLGLTLFIGIKLIVLPKSISN